jgi:hypothetical protein
LACGGVAFDVTFRPDAALPKGLDALGLRLDLLEGVNQPSPWLTPSVGSTLWDGKEREVVWSPHNILE